MQLTPIRGRAVEMEGKASDDGDVTGSDMGSEVGSEWDAVQGGKEVMGMEGAKDAIVAIKRGNVTQAFFKDFWFSSVFSRDVPDDGYRRFKRSWEYSASAPCVTLQQLLVEQCHRRYVLLCFAMSLICQRACQTKPK